MAKLDYYKLMRDYWDFAFENPDLIKPTHCALFAFAVEHCNRMGWKNKFGLPASMVLDAIGIKSYSVYKKTFDDLVEWGFIEVVTYSKNQHSSNVIALKENCKATFKAHDKASVKHVTKHLSTHGEYNKTNIQLDNNTILQEKFKKNLAYLIESLSETMWKETVRMQHKLSEEDLKEWAEKFNVKLIGEEDIKISKKDWKAHFTRWLGPEILKAKNNNNSDDSDDSFHSNRGN
jgi:hypothetical protein